jgi:RNA polymerase sigma-B factor
MAVQTGLAGATGGTLVVDDAELLDDNQLLETYVRSPRDDLREELTRRFSSLARGLARRYDGKGEPLEDLEQVAHVGLVKALDGFDPDRRRPFHAYAVPTILGELRRHFRDHCWSVHVPRGVKDLGMKIPEAVDELSVELERAPTQDEIAKALDVSTDDVVEAHRAKRASRPACLDVPVDASNGDGPELSEVIGAEDPNFERIEDRIVVADRLERLDERECEVLRMRFAEDCTQSEIAERIGVSQMQVSRILRSSLDRLQAE